MTKLIFFATNVTMSEDELINYDSRFFFLFGNKYLHKNESIIREQFLLVPSF